MKKLLAASVFLLLLLFSPSVKAIPAFPYPQKVEQPDGSTVTLRMHGDEFMNFVTTQDGYTVVLNAAGYYVYAQLEDGLLSPTSYVAKDLADRSSDELRYLSSVDKYLVASTQKKEAKALRTAANDGYQRNGLLRRANSTDFSKFRGLVVLVNFKDRKFLRDDFKEVVSDMLNTKGYTGYNDGTTYVECPGSVHDYFSDNSGGKFKPTFDVVGPIELDFNQTDAEKTNNAFRLIRTAAITAAPYVNYSDYDVDGDRVVDMVYFIFAGAGSHVTGNNQLYIWPHASEIMAINYDGVSLGRYACSTELYGLESSKTLDGIGTMCHEFSHVLGLPDLYDSDYGGSGGNSAHPATWSIMANGNFHNQSRTPCCYSLYERYALGWATPHLISGEGTHTLQALGASNEGYRINSPVHNEFFLLENRQQAGWDEYLPGHGMLAYRVDSTNVSIWENNMVNANPEHLYYQLLRAKPQISNGTIIDSGSDPFPGTDGITSLTNQTTPSLLSWSGYKAETVVTDITETDGIVTFRTEAEASSSYLEDFEAMELTSEESITGVQGKFTSWNLTKAQIVAPGGDKANGAHSVAVINGSELVTTVPVDIQVNFASLMFWNPTKLKVKVTLSYSEDGDAWTVAGASSGEAAVTLSPTSSTYVDFYINEDKPIFFKVSVLSGSKTEKCYLDDFTLNYNTKITGLSKNYLSDGDQSSLRVYVENGFVRIESLDSGSSQDCFLYSADGGILIAHEQMNDGKATLQLPGRGVYIIRCGDERRKIVY